MSEYSYMDYFLERTTPQEYYFLAQIDSLLEQLNQTTYIEELTFTLDSYENFTPSDHYSLMHSIFINHANRLIKEFGITLTEEATLSNRVTFLMFVANFKDIEDKEFAKETILDNLTNEEKVALIVSYYTIFSEETLLPLIETADITIMEEILFSNTQLKAVTNSDYYTKIKHFNQFSGKLTLGVLLVRNNITLGQSFSFYFNKVKEVFEKEGISEHAIDIYSIALLSSTGNKDALLVLRDFMDEYVDDESFKASVMKIDSDFNTYLESIKNESN